MSNTLLRKALQRLIFIVTMLAVQGGCTNDPPLRPWPKPLRNRPAETAVRTGNVAEPADAATTTGANARRPPRTLSIEPTPSVRQTQPSAAPASGRPGLPAPRKGEVANITLTFDQEKLPTLIQLVYGTILKKNYTIDPAVASRSDLVTLRAGPQTPSQVETTVRLLLKSYGIAVIDSGNSMVRVIPDSSLSGFVPEVRRGMAAPGTPQSLRPIFQFIELQTVRNTEAAGWIRSMFASRVNVIEDNKNNALMLSGQAEDVSAALDAIHILDVPGMKGRSSVRINPVYLSAEVLAAKLSEILNTEGYAAVVAEGASSPLGSAVTLIPIKAVNAIIVFTVDPGTLGHVTEWAREIDHPTAYGAEPGFFTYQAQNTDAEKLATTLKEMLSTPGGLVAEGQPAADQAGAAGAKPPAPAALGKKVVVNPATNSIVFKGTSEEYAQVRRLLEGLDKPTKAAIIEVTVAEVDLRDSLELGVELSSEMLQDGAFTALTGGAGLTVKYFASGSNSATNAIRALAASKRAHILSSPRLMARNGETATIQVGQQVPFPSSQLGSASNSSIIPGTGTLLTTVQYKDVGVILKVKPIIFSGDRIELEVSQEVSDAQRTTTGVSDAPTINTKKVDTRLALRDGSTVMLGGLISNKDDFSNSGVPLLKDLPILGPLFGFTVESDEQQELIILITPYTVQDDYDARSLTDAFRNQLGSWARPR